MPDPVCIPITDQKFRNRALMPPLDLFKAILGCSKPGGATPFGSISQIENDGATHVYRNLPRVIPRLTEPYEQTSLGPGIVKNNLFSPRSAKSKRQDDPKNSAQEFSLKLGAPNPRRRQPGGVPFWVPVVCRKISGDKDSLRVALPSKSRHHRGHAHHALLEETNMFSLSPAE